MRSALSVLVTIALFTPALYTQDEKSAEAAMLKDWDNFEKRLTKGRKDLAEFQLRFKSAKDDTARVRIREGYKLVRNGLRTSGNILWRNTNTFLARFPSNVNVRERRMRDVKVFDQMAASLKARDAEKLFEVTNDRRFIHDAAEWYDHAYDYANAVRMWTKAAEKAPTLKVLTAQGMSAMNALDFKAAQIAFSRAETVTTVPREAMAARNNAQTAENYMRFWEREKRLRAESDKSKKNPIVEITTERGTLLCELFEDEAPNTVANFVSLIEKGFFDDVSFHRNIANFVIHGGDPDGTGRGGPGYYIKDEQKLPDSRRHFPGSLSMANLQRANTNGSQFFVTSCTSYWLNGQHTVFGRVLRGLDVAQVQPVDPADPTKKAASFKILKAKVTRKRPHEYKFVKLEQ